MATYYVERYWRFLIENGNQMVRMIALTGIDLFYLLVVRMIALAGIDLFYLLSNY